VSIGVPRGWDYSTSSATIPPNIPLLGIPGIAHVLTAAEINVYIGGGPSFGAYAIAVSSIGTSLLGMLYALSNSSDIYSVSWSGNLLIPVGTQLNVELSIFTGVPGNAYWTMEVQGYDT
jgi:hypothetical protein